MEKKSIPLKTSETKQIVRSLDKYLRDKSGMTADEFVRQYCDTFRDYAYATRDDSINEFEKLITHVLGMYIYHRRRSEILGLGTDPRSFVDEHEENDINEVKMYTEEDVQQEVHKAVRKIFDFIAFKACNHFHGNPAVNEECIRESDYAHECIEDALEYLHPDVLREIEELRDKNRNES